MAYEDVGAVLALRCLDMSFRLGPDLFFAMMGCTQNRRGVRVPNGVLAHSILARYDASDFEF